MTQIISPQPMTTLPPTVGVHTAPPVVAVRPVDVMSPAETQFWQEWAEKAPALIRSNGIENLEKFQSSAGAYKMGSVALGAALGAATFTKYISGRWKYLSGSAAAASLIFASAMAGMQTIGNNTKNRMLAYADALEHSPALQQQLAMHLSSSVTADIAASGIENAVLNQAAALALQPAQFQTNAASLMDARSNSSSPNCVPCR